MAAPLAPPPCLAAPGCEREKIDSVRDLKARASPPVAIENVAPLGSAARSRLAAVSVS